VDHVVLSELAAGAALDDLDPRERDALDGHVRTCGPCQALVVELEDVLADLALVAPELTPPASLRVDLLDRLHDPEPVQAPVLLAAGAQDRRSRPRLATWAPLALAAGLAVVAIGLGARTAQLDGELATVTATLAQAEGRDADADAAMAVVADPAHVTMALHPEALAPAAAAVVLYRPGSTDAFLLATDLPATPDGQVYQLWWADERGVHPLGTFRYEGDGPFVAPFGVDLADGAAAMVTLEPMGGATGEPGPQVVFGEL
jgi:anti-sigma-K factor RskA